MKACTIVEEGVPCGLPVLAREMCSTHYQRWHRNGDPLRVHGAGTRQGGGSKRRIGQQAATTRRAQPIERALRPEAAALYAELREDAEAPGGSSRERWGDRALRLAHFHQTGQTE